MINQELYLASVRHTTPNTVRHITATIPNIASHLYRFNSSESSLLPITGPLNGHSAALLRQHHPYMPIGERSSKANVTNFQSYVTVSNDIDGDSETSSSGEETCSEASRVETTSAGEKRQSKVGKPLAQPPELPAEVDPLVSATEAQVKNRVDVLYSSFLSLCRPVCKTPDDAEFVHGHLKETGTKLALVTIAIDRYILFHHRCSDFIVTPSCIINAFYNYRPGHPKFKYQDKNHKESFKRQQHYLQLCLANYIDQNPAFTNIQHLVIPACNLQVNRADEKQFHVLYRLVHNHTVYYYSFDLLRENQKPLAVEEALEVKKTMSKKTASLTVKGILRTASPRDTLPDDDFTHYTHVNIKWEGTSPLQSLQHRAAKGKSNDRGELLKRYYTLIYQLLLHRDTARDYLGTGAIHLVVTDERARQWFASTFAYESTTTIQSLRRNANLSSSTVSASTSSSSSALTSSVSSLPTFSSSSSSSPSQHISIQFPERTVTQYDENKTYDGDNNDDGEHRNVPPAPAVQNYVRATSTSHSLPLFGQPLPSTASMSPIQSAESAINEDVNPSVVEIEMDQTDDNTAVNITATPHLAFDQFLSAASLVSPSQSAESDEPVDHEPCDDEGSVLVDRFSFGIDPINDNAAANEDGRLNPPVVEMDMEVRDTATAIATYTTTIVTNSTVSATVSAVVPVVHFSRGPSSTDASQSAADHTDMTEASISDNQSSEFMSVDEETMKQQLHADLNKIQTRINETETSSKIVATSIQQKQEERQSLVAECQATAQAIHELQDQIKQLKRRLKQQVNAKSNGESAINRVDGQLASLTQKQNECKAQLDSDTRAVESINSSLLTIEDCLQQKKESEALARRLAEEERRDRELKEQRKRERDEAMSNLQKQIQQLQAQMATIEAQKSEDDYTAREREIELQKRKLQESCEERARKMKRLSNGTFAVY